MLAPALARFLGLGPTLEIDCPRDPTGGDWQKQRVTRQQRKEKYLFRVAVKQRSGQNFRGPAARQESRRRRFHGAQEIQKAAEGYAFVGFPAEQPVRGKPTKAFPWRSRNSKSCRRIPVARAAPVGRSETKNT